jgi:DNA-binding transcriptional regulator YiaG
MAPSEFRVIRHNLDWTQAELAERLGVTDRAVKHWEAGERPIRDPIRKLMLLLAACADGREEAALKALFTGWL